MNDAIGAAYRKTHNAICTNPMLQGCFSPSFVERIRDWDEIVARFLSVRDNPSKVELWRDETTRLLQEKGYEEGLIREHVRCVEVYSNFLQKYSFLYVRQSGSLSDIT
jgi:hypothetical protein